MQESDLPDFERALLRLCAGFDTPPTQARKDAYWRAFRKLAVLEFAGLIDAALVESSFASMPTVGALWDLHRKKSAPADQIPRSGPTLQEQLCEYVARRLSHLIGPGATPQERWAFSRPWTYLHRERRDGAERFAECTGVVVEMGDGSVLRFNVAEMVAPEFEPA